MRRILIEQARRKKTMKHGGDRKEQVSLDEIELEHSSSADDILAIHEALIILAKQEPQAARLVELNYFAGVSIADAAEIAGISRTTAYEYWSYARARLRCILQAE